MNAQIKLSERLQDLKTLNEKSKQEFIPVQSKVYEKLMDHKVRQVFVSAMVEILTGYNKFLSYVDELPVFNEKIFINNKSRRDRDFYDKLIDTQNFNYFLQLDTKIQAPYFHSKFYKNTITTRNCSRRESRLTLKNKHGLDYSETFQEFVKTESSMYQNPRPSLMIINLMNSTINKKGAKQDSNNNSFEDEINCQDLIFAKNHILLPSFNKNISSIDCFLNEKEDYASLIEKFNGKEAITNLQKHFILPELCVHRLDLSIVEQVLSNDSTLFRLNEFSEYQDHSKKISYEVSLSMSKKRHSSFSVLNKQISSINTKKYNLNSTTFKASTKTRVMECDHEISCPNQAQEDSEKSKPNLNDACDQNEAITTESRKYSIINRNRGKNIRELNPKQKELVEEFISDTMKNILTSKPISQKSKSSLDSFFKLKDSKKVFAAFLYQNKFEEDQNICLSNHSFLELTEIVFFILLQSADEKYFNDFFYHSIMLVTKSCFHYYTESKHKSQLIYMYQQLTKKQGSFKVWVDSLFWEYWLLFLLNQENKFESDSEFVFNKFINLMNYMFKLKLPGGNINIILCKELGNNYLLNSDREKLKILIQKQQRVAELVSESEISL